jgi:hypothetical protein
MELFLSRVMSGFQKALHKKPSQALVRKDKSQSHVEAYKNHFIYPSGGMTVPH